MKNNNEYMLHFAQYFNLKYIDFILIIFSLITLIIFIQQMINVIKMQKNIENDDADLVINKTNRISAVINIIKFKIIPILFVIIFFISTLNILFPEFIEPVFPCDSMQKIVITNNEDIPQTMYFIGRLSYSNDWIPLTSVTNLHPCPYIKLNVNEKKVVNFRTGVKDIDHILIAKTNNFSINKGSDILVFSVPSNDIAIYTLSMSKLDLSPNIYIIEVINYCFLYITGLVGLVLLFLILFFKIRS